MGDVANWSRKLETSLCTAEPTLRSEINPPDIREARLDQKSGVLSTAMAVSRLA
jgi:hypothetical protein